ncbi:conserved Plasmodium protein, unknown function [Plasmodium malariae]|uniref:Uncharacterized protein n=1 Tax=Plasmodium malariae TaxID=5858 RepID=A0A1A8WC13_PLAMA|nr:conserved Plasmodium protein, unknown function [Plasmodium malariae]SBS89270.1 hypothetical protein PMALA_025470 [Plasmodium malariae]SCP02556.1 conserved Plasmodium protein, unknown function [Plasmodium malariae]
MKSENSNKYDTLKNMEVDSETINSSKHYHQNGIEEQKTLYSGECILINNLTRDINENKISESLNEVKNEELIDKKNFHCISSNISSIPTVIKKNVNISHMEGEMSYIYTLVSFNNYNIFFITHNGKFASWVYSYNVTLPFSVEQETEIIFGERNYPYLEMFCSKFMKDHAPLLKYKPIMFAISLYKMCFHDTKILTQIFASLSNMIK